ncbi:MAG: sialidase family protein [Methylococcales bacterium]
MKRVYKLAFVAVIIIFIWVKLKDSHFSMTPAIVNVALNDIKSLDVVADKKAVHLLVAGQDTQHDHTTIKYGHLENGAFSWHDINDLDSKLNSIAARGNDTQLAVSGENLVALWQVKGELPNMGPLISYYSHDGGKTWKKGTNPAGDDKGDQSHADIIADASGYFHAVWLADPEENGYQSLIYARSIDGGEHWELSKALDNSTCSCCWNTLTLSPNGTLSVLYRDMKPRDMSIKQSVDRGDSWSEKITIGDFKWEFDGCPHIGGGLATDENNALYSTVWTGQADIYGLYSLASNDGGHHWSTPNLLSKLASHSDISVNNKRVVTVWDERTATNIGVYFAKSQDGGLSWSSKTRLSSASTLAGFPRIVPMGDDFIVMWTEKNDKQVTQLIIQTLN